MIKRNSCSVMPRKIISNRKEVVKISFPQGGNRLRYSWVKKIFVFLGFTHLTQISFHNCCSHACVCAASAGMVNDHVLWTQFILIDEIILVENAWAHLVFLFHFSVNATQELNFLKHVFMKQENIIWHSYIKVVLFLTETKEKLSKQNQFFFDSLFCKK